MAPPRKAPTRRGSAAPAQSPNPARNASVPSGGVTAFSVPRTPGPPAAAKKTSPKAASPKPVVVGTTTVVCEPQTFDGNAASTESYLSGIQPKKAVAKQTREQAASARVRSHPSIMVLKWGLNGELQIVTVKIRNPQLAVFVDKVARAMHEGGTTRFGSSGDESPAAAAMAFSVDQSPHSPTAVESYASILALYLSVLGQIVQSLCGNGYTGPINMRSIMECTDLTRSPPSGRFTSSQIPPTSPAGLAIMRIMSIIATQAKGLKADFARDLMNADCTIVTSMAPVIPVYIAASSNPEAIARDARFMADREEALQLHYKDQPTATPTRQPAKKAGAVQAIDPQPSPAAEPAPVSMDVDQQQHLTEAADRPPPSDGAAPEEQQLPMEQQQQSFTEQQLAEEASAAAPEQDDAPPQDDAALEPPQNESAVDEADNECQEAGQQMMIDDEEEDAEPLDYGEDDDE